MIAVAVVVALFAVVAGGYLYYLARTFDSNSSKIEQAFPDESTRPQKAKPEPGQAGTPLNILLMGSDSRGATGADAEKGAATDQRANTLMLVHIPADRKNVYTMSVMRDLWVDIPGHGQAKINADYQRVRNQQEYLKAVVKKSIDGQTLSNPVTISNLVGAISPYVSVDKSLNAAALGGLALELKDVRARNTVMFALPTGGIGTSADGQSIVLTDPNAIRDISRALASDTLDKYVAANKFQNGN
nr:LCP family protein [Arthrobacter sp. C9C5]